MIERSAIMRSVRSRDTAPERIVRRIVTLLGYRYRLHKASLPGKPDLVFASRRKTIFVHGCFWHGHNCKRGSREPKTNRDYWLSKIERNRQRDQRSVAALSESGWTVLVVWECAMRDLPALTDKIADFLK